MKLLDTTPQLFSPEKAEAVAAALQAGDSDWTYVAKQDPDTGLSVVEVYDEAGNHVGNW